MSTSRRTGRIDNAPVILSQSRIEPVGTRSRFCDRDVQLSARGRACLRLAWQDRGGRIRLWLGRVFGFVAGGLDLQISLVLVVFRGARPWWRIAGQPAGPGRYVITHVPAARTGCKETGSKDHDEKAHHGGRVAWLWGQNMLSRQRRIELRPHLMPRGRQLARLACQLVPAGG